MHERNYSKENYFMNLAEIKVLIIQEKCVSYFVFSMDRNISILAIFSSRYISLMPNSTSQTQPLLFTISFSMKQELSIFLIQFSVKTMSYVGFGFFFQRLSVDYYFLLQLEEKREMDEHQIREQEFS